MLSENKVYLKIVKLCNGHLLMHSLIDVSVLDADLKNTYLSTSLRLLYFLNLSFVLFTFNGC